MNKTEQISKFKTIKQLSEELQIDSTVIRKRVDELNMRSELKKEKNAYVLSEEQEKRIKASFGFMDKQLNVELNEPVEDIMDLQEIDVVEENIPFKDDDFLNLTNEQSEINKETKKKWFQFKRSENYQVEILGTLITLVVLMVVCVVTLSQIVNRSHLEDIEKLDSISQQIKHLETRVDSLEESLRLTEKDKLDINIDVN